MTDRDAAVVVFFEGLAQAAAVGAGRGYVSVDDPHLQAVQERRRMSVTQHCAGSGNRQPYPFPAPAPGDGALVFGSVAGEYQVVRPGYPGALYDTLDRLADGLTGRRVADLGAGTGIASAALAHRGAVVVAVEPDMAMLGTLRSAHPGIAAIAGRAELLPLRTRAVDMITCAQVWHWVELATARAECRRVLRPGGHLALWWNVSGSGADWLAEIRQLTGLVPYGARRHRDDRDSLVTPDGFARVRYADIPWEWRVSAEQWLRMAATRSALVKLGPRAHDQLALMREVLRRYFPDGYVTEQFTCHLAVAST